LFGSVRIDWNTIIYAAYLKCCNAPSGRLRRSRERGRFERRAMAPPIGAGGLRSAAPAAVAQPGVVGDAYDRIDRSAAELDRLRRATFEMWLRVGISAKVGAGERGGLANRCGLPLDTP